MIRALLGSLWLFFALCVPTAAFAATDLSDFFKGLTTLHANFEQQLVDSNQQVIESSQGVVDLQRPGKFRWEYLTPYAQLIVTNGERIWIYDQDLEQVTIKSYKTALGNTPALLLSSTQDLKDSFTVESVPSEQENETLYELRPKDKEAQFERIRLRLMANTLRELVLYDNLGHTTRIGFMQIQTNLPIAASLFEFTPPAGVDLIDSLEQ